MPRLDVVVECPVHDSFRVQQVAGMFDVPLADRAMERFQVELPDTSDAWQIGLIVGPSGSGKTTVARQAFGASVFENARWPHDRAIVDCFGVLAARRVVELLTCVGFGSPPSWVKPYHVLSGGERFRCDLARALATSQESRAERQGPGTQSEVRTGSVSRQPLVVFDEFTSVVDRDVANIASAAIAKAVRGGQNACRFVAVTSHYDITEWLAPDWTLDMATCQLTRSSPGTAGGSFRRPPIELEIYRCRVAAWQLFRRHHYLSRSLARGARCYLATWRGVPVNFCATVPLLSKKNHRRFTRIVTLPDYQGVGIGMRAMAAVAEIHRAQEHRINVTSSHPSLIRHCRRSPLWKAVGINKGVPAARSVAFPRYTSAAGRAVVSFEFIGTN